MRLDVKEYHETISPDVHKNKKQKFETRATCDMLIQCTGTISIELTNSWQAADWNGWMLFMDFPQIDFEGDQLEELYLVINPIWDEQICSLSKIVGQIWSHDSSDDKQELLKMTKGWYTNCSAPMSFQTTPRDNKMIGKLSYGLFSRIRRIIWCLQKDSHLFEICWFFVSLH